MHVYSVRVPYNVSQPQKVENIPALISQIGQEVAFPDAQRNYTLFNLPLVDKIVSKKEEALPPLLNMLGHTQNEKQIAEGLYIIDRMIDAGMKNIDKTYPVISRFNQTNNPTIQVMLAGIYRKAPVPDAFGPLMSMLLKNTFSPPAVPFDPNEEVGGAMLDILNYFRNKHAVSSYAAKPSFKGVYMSTTLPLMKEENIKKLPLGANMCSEYYPYYDVFLGSTSKGELDVTVLKSDPLKFFAERGDLLKDMDINPDSFRLAWLLKLLNRGLHEKINIYNKKQNIDDMSEAEVSEFICDTVEEHQYRYSSDYLDLVN